MVKNATKLRGRQQLAASIASPPTRLELHLVGGYRVFIPLQANPENVGNVQQAVLDIVGLLQNGIGPVLWAMGGGGCPRLW